MSETSIKKPDISAIGPQFGNRVVSHTQKHQEATVQAERDQHLSELKDRLKYIFSAPQEGLGGKRKTNEYDVETLDTGAKVTAHLASADTGGPKAVAEDLVIHSSDGSRAAIYKREGPLSAQFTDYFRENDAIDMQVPAGLEVYLNLVSTAGEHETRDDVFVGAILDPESIRVPEEVDGITDAERIIGPNDPRFEPIMDTVALINQGVGTWGEKRHVG